jgi:hypothetical protein
MSFGSVKKLPALTDEMRSRIGEPFQLCLARSLSSHLSDVKRDPPHPYHQGC